MSVAPSPNLADEPTNAEKIRRLPWSIASNTANTVFVQYTFFGSAFILFLNQLELNNSQIGFLLSLFPFFGIVTIFIAPTVARFGYKRTPSSTTCADQLDALGITHEEYILLALHTLAAY